MSLFEKNSLRLKKQNKNNLKRHEFQLLTSNVLLCIYSILPKKKKQKNPFPKQKP